MNPSKKRTLRLIAVAGLLLPLCPLSAASEETAQIAASAAPLPAGEAEGPGDPTAPIERLNLTLIEIMKSAEGGASYQDRFERASPVVLEIFDMPFMAAKSIGGSWRKLSPDERKRWVKTFGDFTISNFADRFDGFSGQSLEVRGERPASRGDNRVVDTLLVRPDDEDVELDYRMSDRAGTWRVVDIYSDGSVSEVALRRSEYSSVLKNGGIEKLITLVTAKTAKRAVE
ncbi:MAG: ABC transporter substrate-binding protein [Myxococcota bacterium]|nr:ABC transporter substrate-binding protein [Myxococcota bacterium]